MPRAVVGLVALLAVGGAMAQSSSSFKLEEHAFNAGSHPDHGTTPQSASYNVTLDSLGDSVATRALTGSSFRMTAGFALSYPPPGEVAAKCGQPGAGCMQLAHTGGAAGTTTLSWPAESSVGSYNLYRDTVSNLLDLGYGVCDQTALPDEMTTDDEPVPSNDGFFYLITAENLLGEEGTKGFRIEGETTIERLGSVCP